MITHIHKTSQKAYSDSIAITDMVENMVKQSYLSKMLVTTL